MSNTVAAAGLEIYVFPSDWAASVLARECPQAGFVTEEVSRVPRVSKQSDEEQANDGDSGGGGFKLDLEGDIVLLSACRRKGAL